MTTLAQPEQPLELDEKAARALERFARRGYRAAAIAARLGLALWVLRSRARLGLKRALDLAGALLLVLLAAPVMLLAALAIRLDSPGPIFFRQTRVGRHGRPFTLFKFRSMSSDAEARKAELLADNEADGPVFKMRRDPRITRVGRVIRRWSVDELPQLFNVLRGEMSLVGPRPALPAEVEQYSYDQLRRLDVMPGITGLQQVSGRSNLDFQRWVELDLQYVAEQSLLTDMRILLRTAVVVLRRDGAY